MGDHNPVSEERREHSAEESVPSLVTHARSALTLRMSSEGAITARGCHHPSPGSGSGRGVSVEYHPPDVTASAGSPGGQL